MIVSRCVRVLTIILLFSIIASFTFAQAVTEDKQFEPVYFQPGKDVVWVPTSNELVKRMLDMAQVTPQDFVIDLGSGDGRTVIAAAKLGARALGVEYNPYMVTLSKSEAVKAGVADKAQFIEGDLFDTDLTKATVITMFLMPDINIKLRPKILDLKPGTRIVSNTFNMGEWADDQRITIDETLKCTSYCTAYLWIVPAKIEGTWKLANGELTLAQSFQIISGKLTSGNYTRNITNGRLNGHQVVFSVDKDQYTGRVNGNTMEGTITSGAGKTKWTAIRTDKAAQVPSK